MKKFLFLALAGAMFLGCGEESALDKAKKDVEAMSEADFDKYYAETKCRISPNAQASLGADFNFDYNYHKAVLACEGKFKDYIAEQSRMKAEISKADINFRSLAMDIRAYFTSQSKFDDPEKMTNIPIAKDNMEEFSMLSNGLKCVKFKINKEKAALGIYKGADADKPFCAKVLSNGTLKEAFDEMGENGGEVPLSMQ